jgi:hypothetical protein
VLCLVKESIDGFSIGTCSQVDCARTHGIQPDQFFNSRIHCPGKFFHATFSRFLMKNSSTSKKDLLTSKPIESNEKDMDSFIHMDYIRHLADSQNGDGTAEVEAYHRALYMNQCG